jgi:hypothetical protein
MNCHSYNCAAIGIHVHAPPQVDLYGATPLISLSDDALIQRLLRTHMAAAMPDYADAQVRRFTQLHALH